MSLPCNRTDNAQNYESEVDPGVVEVRVAVLRLDLADWQARGVTHPSQGGGPPTMSASHSKELPGTVSELVGRRFRIVPDVGLFDRDVNDHAQLLEWRSDFSCWSSWEMPGARVSRTRRSVASTGGPTQWARLSDSRSMSLVQAR